MRFFQQRPPFVLMVATGAMCTVVVLVFALSQGVLAAGVPLFAICLGHQLLALASGAKSMKMATGHHGANHPVQDIAKGT